MIRQIVGLVLAAIAVFGLLAWAYRRPGPEDLGHVTPETRRRL